MIPFLWKAWWRYRRAAKGRHGTHSPFVYRFVDEGLWLRDRSPLLERCLHFLQERTCHTVLILPADLPAQKEGFARAAPLLRSGTVIAIPGIHKDAERLNFWRKYCNDARVNLSIELWNLGLLFYKEDFKERQHFVLKAPR